MVFSAETTSSEVFPDEVNIIGIKSKREHIPATALTKLFFIFRFVYSFMDISPFPVFFDAKNQLTVKIPIS
jgi:hypothetical protein